MYFIASPVARIFQSASYLARVFLVKYLLYELNKTGDTQHPCLSALLNSHILCLLGLAILIHEYFLDQYLSLASRKFYFIYSPLPSPLMAQQPLLGQDLLIVEVSRSHSDTPQSVGLLWTSDQSDAETSTWQHTTLTRNRHPCSGGFRTHNPSMWATADPRLIQRGQEDRTCAL